MALTQMEFTPATGFRDPVAFPDPATESDARDQVQDIPDQLRDYINNNLLPDLLSTSNGKGASQIGVEDSGGKYAGVTVEAVLLEIANLISTHTAETVTYQQNVSRDVSVTGTQRITLPFKAKAIIITAFVYPLKTMALGQYGESGSQYSSMIDYNGNSNGTNGSAIVLLVASGAQAYGTIGNVTSTGFDIVWTKTGSPTGTAIMSILAITH